MAQRVKLYQRLRTKRFPTVRVKCARNGVPLQDANATTYYLRYSVGGARHCDPAGPNLLEADNLRKVKEVQLFASKHLGVQPARPAVSQSGRKTIAEAIEMYAAAISRKSKKTQSAYMQAVREFASRCKKTFLDEIKREDLLSCRDCIDREPLTKHSKLARVVIWLNTEGIKRLLQSDDWPEYELPTPDSYDADEIAKMMAAAGSEDRLVLQFFLTTGFRMGEVSHAEYGDIDYRNCTITTQPKPHWDWEPKKTSVKDRKKAKRTVRIPESLVLEIAERRETAEDPDGLIFPNGSDKPNMHLLRVVQQVAKAAGLEGRIGLHKFRRTFATRYAKKQGVKDAADMLGHKHLDQIMRYVAATKPESEEQRRHTEEVFSDVWKPKACVFAS